MRKITIKDVIDIPYDVVVKNICNFVEGVIKETNPRKIVIGLSGGLDSSTLLATLIHRMPVDLFVALIMPDSRITPREDVEDAIELAENYGVEYHVIYIDNIVDSYRVAPFYNQGDKLPLGNLRARIRMNLLYYYANKYAGMVVGTSDRSELLLGYFTKYGDGASDIAPLGCLYKTQVRELARRLGLPEKIINKPSAPRLWEDHLAEEELGYKYTEIDVALYALFDLGLSVERAVEMTDLPVELFKRVIELHRKTRHKRRIPLIPGLPWLREPIREI
ncbi:MAG: NAD+ synthase [Desulfurococcaceae archaeon]